MLSNYTVVFFCCCFPFETVSVDRDIWSNMYQPACEWVCLSVRLFACFSPLIFILFFWSIILKWIARAHRPPKTTQHKTAHIDMKMECQLTNDHWSIICFENSKWKCNCWNLKKLTKPFWTSTSAGLRFVFMVNWKQTNFQLNKKNENKTNGMTANHLESVCYCFETN